MTAYQKLVGRANRACLIWMDCLGWREKLRTEDLAVRIIRLASRRNYISRVKAGKSVLGSLQDNGIDISMRPNFAGMSSSHLETVA